MHAIIFAKIRLYRIYIKNLQPSLLCELCALRALAVIFSGNYTEKIRLDKSPAIEQCSISERNSADGPPPIVYPCREVNSYGYTCHTIKFSADR